MDSYVVSCKYAEPQFPPCEEDYSHFSDQGGYYSSPQDSGGYGGAYQSMQPPPPPYTAQQQAAYQHSVQGQRREDAVEEQQQQQQHHQQQQRHQAASFTDYRGTDAAADKQGGYPAADLQCQAWVTYAKPAQVQRKAACQAKDKPPVIVYPWMKKVHVAHGEQQDLRAFIFHLLPQHHRVYDALLSVSFPLSVFLSFCPFAGAFFLSR